MEQCKINYSIETNGRYVSCITHCDDASCLIELSSLVQTGSENACRAAKSDAIAN